MKPIVVIDDSGSPGSNRTSKFLKEKRKTWAGVFIDEYKIQSIRELLNETNTILHSEYGITELHFTDLINGNHEYKNLNQTERLTIFGLCCKVFQDLNLKYFIQTCTPDTLGENGIILKMKDRAKIGEFDLKDLSDQPLIMLLRTLRHKLLEELGVKGEIDIIVDEGKKRPGTTSKLQILDGLTSDSILKFESSKNEVLLQLADFVAYGINRFQTTLVKEPHLRSNFDKLILIHLSRALENGGISGVSIIKQDINIVTKDDYDYEQIIKRQIHGNLEKFRHYNRNRENLK